MEAIVHSRGGYSVVSGCLRQCHGRAGDFDLMLLFWRLKRRRDRHLRIPAFRYSMSDGGMIDSKSGASLADEHLVSINEHTSHIAPVPTLQFSWQPFAIFRCVVAVCISALKGMLVGRAASHVGQETLKRGCARFSVEPSVADGDASASVILEVVGRRLCASASHRHPCIELRSLTSLSRKTMHRLPTRQFFSHQAAAAC